MTKKIIHLSWDEILAKIKSAKKKHSITSKTKIYGVPKNGMILSGFFDCKNVSNPEDADIILDDIIDSGRTKKKYKKLYPKKKFIALYSKDKNVDWVNFPFEKQVDEDQQETVVRLLEIIGEDPNREGLKNTPKRYLDAFSEFLNPPEFNITTFDVEKTDEMIVQLDIPFYSFCEHHLLPFFGKGYIAYIPNKKIVGISKLSRTLEKFSRRLQNQERITNQVADYLESELGAKGVGVVLKARHLCMEMRGVKKSDTHTVTSKLLGYFRTDERTRAEFLNLIGNHRN
ncbi:MAG: GTP cyclohydrolase I FolE [Thermodesulfobacteriota bacterium]|nr:GTP cyclohydrolase I FolE [Thermodesulfobacteriota bacterium]|tara:strand:- start:9302 stop:10159 length:858 start_codon:yes stop_codon:yes gene_type:complete